MKINLTNQILYVVLGICLLAAMFFCVQSINANGDYRNYSGRATAINNWQNTVKALALDCIEYSKRNPAMEPLLQSVGVRSKQAPAQPPAKAPTR